MENPGHTKIDTGFTPEPVNDARRVVEALSAEW
jgi:hypothetical protein